ncbi:MAG: response regulator [Cyanobacteria bacterium P01_A01_bin.123]
MATHILLIEDNTRTAQLLKMDLADEGYQVSMAHDGLSGLALANRICPDLVLLDWRLPYLSGLEICDKLRRLGHTFPIMFLTAMTDNEHRASGLAVGANDYVIKPFDPDALLAKIRNYFQSSDLTVA